MIRGETGMGRELEQENAKPAPRAKRNRETVPDMQGRTESGRRLFAGMTRFPPESGSFTAGAHGRGVHAPVRMHD